MSDRLTPYGLSTLEIATTNVLRAFEMGDWEGSLIRLRILAYTPGDEEIISLVEKHINSTQKIQDQIRAGTVTLTPAENINSTKLQNHVRERALDLYKQLRLQMKKKKLISYGGQISEDAFDKLEEEE